MTAMQRLRSVAERCQGHGLIRNAVIALSCPPRGANDDGRSEVDVHARDQRSITPSCRASFVPVLGLEDDRDEDPPQEVRHRSGAPIARAPGGLAATLYS